MALFDFPHLHDSRCDRLDISGRLLLGKTEYSRLRKAIKTRAKEVHALLLRHSAGESGTGVVFSEHFGLDAIEADSVSSWGEIPRRCSATETPVALFHWSVRSFPSDIEVTPFLDEQTLIERVNDWMATLSAPLEVNVSAFLSYSLSDYRCTVPLPLSLSREQLGGFTEAPGVWLVKRQDDSLTGPSIYEVYVTQQQDRLGLRVEFRSLARGTTETIQSLLDAAKQVASFAVVSSTSSV